MQPACFNILIKTGLKPPPAFLLSPCHQEPLALAGADDQVVCTAQRVLKQAGPRHALHAAHDHALGQAGGREEAEAGLGLHVMEPGHSRNPALSQRWSCMEPRGPAGVLVTKAKCTVWQHKHSIDKLQSRKAPTEIMLVLNNIIVSFPCSKLVSRSMCTCFTVSVHP